MEPDLANTPELMRTVSRIFGAVAVDSSHIVDTAHTISRWGQIIPNSPTFQF